MNIIKISIIAPSGVASLYSGGEEFVLGDGGRARIGLSMIWVVVGEEVVTYIGAIDVFSTLTWEVVHPTYPITLSE